MEQRLTKADAAVVTIAQRKRLATIDITRDRAWLEELSGRPASMLNRMASRGALIPLGGGRYAIAEIGSTTTGRLDWRLLADAQLSALGRYYIGFHSALEMHRLTDVSEPIATVAVDFRNNKLVRRQLAAGGRMILSARTEREVFSGEYGIERVRIDRSTQYFQSSPTRTLVDCLWHPELAGHPETWITAWGRAIDHEQLDAELACKYALSLGPSVARRLGWLLDVANINASSRKHLHRTVPRTSSPSLLVARAGTSETDVISSDWGLRLNIPQSTVERWVSYGK